MVVIYGLIGLSLIALAFILNTLDISSLDPLGFIYTTALFTTGYWLLFDSIDYKLNKTSILHKIQRKHKKFFYLLLIGIAIGLIFDFFGAYIANLWEYPIKINEQIILYAKGVLFGYGIPILMYYSIYRVILTLLTKKLGTFGIKLTTHKKEAKIFKLLGILGIIMFLIPIFAITFFPFENPIIRGLLFSFTLIGLWLILEFIEYFERERSLLKDIFHGYWNPILTIIIGAVLTGFVWEFLNLLRPVWTYKNYPLSELNIFGVPIVILIGWIFLFIVYLSFYRAIFKGREDIW